jgi:hypothetical protein
MFFLWFLSPNQFSSPIQLTPLPVFHRNSVLVISKSPYLILCIVSWIVFCNFTAKGEQTIGKDMLGTIEQVLLHKRLQTYKFVVV